MAWHAATSVLTNLNFYQATEKPKGIAFLETFKTRFYYVENNPNNTRNNMKSQIKNKKDRSISLWSYSYQFRQNFGLFYSKWQIANNIHIIISVHGFPTIKYGGFFSEKGFSWGKNFFWATLWEVILHSGTKGIDIGGIRVLTYCV